MDMLRRPASVANAIPIGVPLHREKVERQLAAREEALEPARLAGGGPTRLEKARRRAEEAFPLEDGLGAGSVLWEANATATRNMLVVGDDDNLVVFRRLLVGHAEAHGDFWRVRVPEAEADQVRALSASIAPMRSGQEMKERLLLVVDRPESQEVLSLLTRFAVLVRKEAEHAGYEVHLAVLTESAAVVPNTLMRHLGFRVAFAGTGRSESRDVVGDASVATLPRAAGFEDAAVVYEESRVFHPEYGGHRVDLPGKRYGRRREVYVKEPSATEKDETGAPADADAVPAEGGG